MSIVASRARARSGTGRSGKGGLLSGVAGALKHKLKGRGMKHRRGRGITSRELRGFRKVVNLLHKVGMQPKRLGRVHHRSR